MRGPSIFSALLLGCLHPPVPSTPVPLHPLLPLLRRLGRGVVADHGLSSQLPGVGQSVGAEVVELDRGDFQQELSDCGLERFYQELVPALVAREEPRLAAVSREQVLWQGRTEHLHDGIAWVPLLLGGHVALSLRFKPPLHLLLSVLLQLLQVVSEPGGDDPPRPSRLLGGGGRVELRAGDRRTRPFAPWRVGVGGRGVRGGLEAGWRREPVSVVEGLRRLLWRERGVRGHGRRRVGSPLLVMGGRGRVLLGVHVAGVVDTAREEHVLLASALVSARAVGRESVRIVAVTLVLQHLLRGQLYLLVVLLRGDGGDLLVLRRVPSVRLLVAVRGHVGVGVVVRGRRGVRGGRVLLGGVGCEL